MASEYLEDAKAEFISNLSPKSFTLSLDKYDADNETFTVISPDFGDLIVPVPIGEAEKFKNGWAKVIAYPSYEIHNDVLTLVGVAFKPDKGKSKKVYYYRNENYVPGEEIDIKFDFAPTPIPID